MFDMKSLGGFADVDLRLSLDADTRLAVTLLVYQAYSAGQQDGLRRAEAVAQRHMVELATKLLPDDASNGNTSAPGRL